MDNPIKIEHQLLADLLPGLSGRGMDYSSSVLRKHYPIKCTDQSISPLYLLIQRQSSREHLKSSSGTELRWLKEPRASRWVLGGPWPLRRSQDGRALLQHSTAVGFPLRMQARVWSQRLYLAKITHLSMYTTGITSILALPLIHQCKCKLLVSVSRWKGYRISKQS